MARCLRDAFATMPRGEIDYEIGTDLRLNALESAPRFMQEEMDVTQGKLVIGFRLGECMEEPDQAALHVFNCLFGGGVSSKLFVNVREKLQLCYYASSMIDLHKGLLLVASGIAFDSMEAARDEILRQLELIAQGEITDEEWIAARTGVASDLRALMDSQGELEGFTLSQAIDGHDYGPLELAELVEAVTKEELSAIARSVECDLIYFLSGTEEEDGHAADEI